MSAAPETMDCDICGHRYPQPYMAETVMGEGAAEETITHCRDGRCATGEAHQEYHRVAVVKVPGGGK